MRRLEKYLVECGIGTRREIKKIVASGEIKVNGEIVYDERIDVFPEEDKITYKDEKLSYKTMKYYAMNKIKGYITAMKDENGKQNVADLIPSWVERQGLFPIGRLDKDTEGLLLFTNDGDLCHAMSSPKTKCDKIYYVELARNISEEDIEKLETGVEFDGYSCMPSEIERIDENKINLTIHEGKYHQVKKMLKSVGNRVTYLKRIKFGNFNLGNISPGEMIEIKREDIIK